MNASIFIRAAVLAVLFSLNGAQIPNTVVELDGKTFEHDTQAASGQTTGHWCVIR